MALTYIILYMSEVEIQGGYQNVCQIISGITNKIVLVWTFFNHKYMEFF